MPPELELFSHKKAILWHILARSWGLPGRLCPHGHCSQEMAYLIDKHFFIKTDHYALKFLTEQKVKSPPTEVDSKLLGYKYTIVVYRKGSENIVVDALSKRFQETTP